MRSAHLNGDQNVPLAHFVFAVTIKSYACGHAVNTSFGETDAFIINHYPVVVEELDDL